MRSARARDAVRVRFAPVAGSNRIRAAFILIQVFGCKTESAKLFVEKPELLPVMPKDMGKEVIRRLKEKGITASIHRAA